MKTRIIFYLISVLLLVTLVLAAENGEMVDNPSDCSSGYARFVRNANGSGSQAYCIDASAATQWAIPLDTIQNTTSVIAAAPMSEEALKVQLDLAESATIWTQADELYWDYKFNGFGDDLIGVKEYNRDIWQYIWAFAILLLETVKLIFYVFELLIVVYVLFSLIPGTFFKLRDALVRGYIRRQAQ